MKTLLIVLFVTSLAGCGVDPCVELDRSYQTRAARATAARLVVSVHRDLALAPITSRRFSGPTGETWSLRPATWSAVSGCQTCLSAGFDVIGSSPSVARLTMTLSTTVEAYMSRVVATVTDVEASTQASEAVLRELIGSTWLLVEMRRVGPVELKLRPSLAVQIKPNQLDVTQTYPGLEGAAQEPGRVDRGVKIAVDSKLAVSVLTAAVEAGKLRPSGRVIFDDVVWSVDEVLVNYREIAPKTCDTTSKTIAIRRQGHGLLDPGTGQWASKITELLLTLMPEHILATPRAAYIDSDNAWHGVSVQGLDPGIVQLTRALERCASPPDTLIVQWTVTPQGVAEDVEIVGATLEQPFRECVFAAFTAAVFNASAKPRTLRREFIFDGPEDALAEP